MKIFSIKNTCEGYDSFRGHIIVANYKSEVVELAKGISEDETEQIWDSADIQIQGDYSGVNTNPFILLSDYNAG